MCGRYTTHFITSSHKNVYKVYFIFIVHSLCATEMKRLCYELYKWFSEHFASGDSVVSFFWSQRHLIYWARVYISTYFHEQIGKLKITIFSRLSASTDAHIKSLFRATILYTICANLFFCFFVYLHMPNSPYTMTSQCDSLRVSIHNFSCFTFSFGLVRFVRCCAVYCVLCIYTTVYCTTVHSSGSYSVRFSIVGRNQRTHTNTIAAETTAI